MAGGGGLPAPGPALGRSWLTAAPNVAGTETILYFATSEIVGAGNFGKIYRSLDSGESSSELTAARGYIRRSVDGGVTWRASADGVPDIAVNALVFDPVVADRVWAGTDQGVYVSLNGGISWAPAGNGMPAVPVFDLAAGAATHQLLACTHGRGAFLLDLDSFSPIFADGFEHGLEPWSLAFGG
jgi:hypothetical protein